MFPLSVFSRPLGINDPALHGGQSSLPYGKLTVTAAMLSQSGLSGFNAAQTVDGDTGTNAFYTDSSGIGSYLAVDFGAGNNRSVTRARFYIGWPVTATWKIQYSDNGTDWTDASGTFGASDPAGWKETSWTSVGYHRYWRAYKTDAAGGGNYHTEFELWGT